MDLVLGVDLGSTTCKAVVLDRAGTLLGRGLAPTRGHYATAIAAASAQARLAARLALLVRAGQIGADQVATLTRHGRRLDDRQRHATLHARLLELAAKAAGGRGEALILALGPQVDAWLDAAGPEDGPPGLFSDRIAGHYLAACADQGPFARDLVMQVMDQALAAVEQEATSLDEAARLGALLASLPGHGGRPPAVGPLAIGAQVGTGYGRQLLPFPPQAIRSEILCHARGIHRLFPGARTLLDIGGQDTKAIQLDEDGLVSSFTMNDRCAAGCGRYLGYVAEELGLGLTELGELACTACRPAPVTSTCTVFASAELRGLLAAGERRDEVLLGAHRAIVRRAFSLLARAGGVRNEFAMTGGVALNPAVRRLVTELMPRYHPDIRIRFHPDSIYVGAYGAALFALESC